MNDKAERRTFGRISLKRLTPLLALLTGLVVFYALGLHKYVNLDTLRENREAVQAWVGQHGFLAALIYTAAYAAVVAFSLPGGALMTIVGGFMFGLVPAAACVVVGATIGATVLFLAARTALGDFLRTKTGPALKRMESGFRENALSYLLVLRLIPLFPFWLVNLVPAFLGVSLRTYVIATFIGIIPGTLVYASFGNGLGEVLDLGQEPNLGIIFNPEILIPLIGLAVLALLPVLYKKYKSSRSRTSAAD